MSRPFDFYDRVAIATIVVFSCYLIGGTWPCVKHGFHKSSGWGFLVILALARLIGSSLRLATINDPTNDNLYIGWMVLNGLGLGPLVAMLTGLLTRAFEGIAVSRGGDFAFCDAYQKVVNLLMLVGLILVIVGGTESDFSVDGNSEPHVNYAGLSVAGIAIFVAVAGALLIEQALAVTNWTWVLRGERRIVATMGATLPFVIVRLVYSCIEVFGEKTPTKGEYVSMFVVMEMIIVFMCEMLGYTLGNSTSPSQKQRGSPGLGRTLGMAQAQDQEGHARYELRKLHSRFWG
ncbi:inhibitor of apoptosis-promoting bax1 domain-containing protein [Purpureocillium lilacinum]|uniref:Inhibitor of apoptosis-promoting bax1 domain-containing protein n=1 Tax=Purpureocillium lilacinum TaxID=33203 RepID=A0A179F043_PURLI|nr:inhibitor of apoptosis-promoting bax1 domain-containing protein [Purpureocillium lilacinum]